MVGANILQIIVEVVDKAVTKKLSNIQKQVDVMSKSASKGLKAIQNAFLGLGLALLFTGMSIKRLADNALRSIFNTYQIIMGETSEFAILTNQLRANWEFFKFTLMDALMQTGLFQMFVGFLINILQWFSELSPTTRAWLVLFIVGLAILGGLMMFFGQLLLFTLGLIALIGVVGMPVFIAIMLAILGIIIVIGAVVLLFILWNSKLSLVAKIILTVVLVALIILGLVLMGVSLPIIILILLFAALVFAIYAWVKHGEDAMGNFKLAWLNFVYQLSRAWDWLVNGIIDGLNWIFEWMNKVFGTDFQVLAHIDTASGAYDNLAAAVSSEEERRAQKQSNTVVNNEVNIFGDTVGGFSSGEVGTSLLDQVNEQWETRTGSPLVSGG